MQHEPDNKKAGGWGMWFWMAACCIPMIGIALLISLGYWNLR